MQTVGRNLIMCSFFNFVPTKGASRDMRDDMWGDMQGEMYGDMQGETG